MSSDPAHGVGIFIVDFATEYPLAPRAILGRRDHFVHRLEAARTQQGKIHKRGRAKPHRFEDPILAVAVEAAAGTTLEASPVQSHWYLGGTSTLRALRPCSGCTTRRVGSRAARW